MLYWLKRFVLNVRGFLAATLAAVLPGASPFVRKLLATWATAGLIWVHARLGIEYVASPETNDIIQAVVEGVMGTLGAFAVWRLPNERPTTTDMKNPIIGTATDVPPT